MAARTEPYSIEVESLRRLWLHRQVAHGDETRRDVVRVGFEGLGADFVVRGEMPIPGVHHFFLGNDPSRWVTGVERYERVVLESHEANLVVSCRADGTRVDLMLQGRTTTPTVISASRRTRRRERSETASMKRV